MVRLPNFRITGAKWSPNGAFLAVCGHDLTREEHSQAAFYFLSAYGQVKLEYENLRRNISDIQIMGYHRLVDHTKITGICWGATGLRMTVSVDNTLLVGQVRPKFKVG